MKSTEITMKLERDVHELVSVLIAEDASDLFWVEAARELLRDQMMVNPRAAFANIREWRESDERSKRRHE
jgi:hypothetical protein